MPALLSALGFCLAGCQHLPPQAPPPPVQSDTPSNDRDLAAAVWMGDTFQSMERLAQSAPAEQAEIVSAAREAFQRSPRGNAQLRYALLLATPGHPARNPARAQTLLRELIAQPEALEPVERAVVMVELAQLDRELDLQFDNTQLQSNAQRVDQQRNTSEGRRLQAEIDENAKLHKQLEEAQAKLDAVAKIERNLTERRPDTGSAPEAHTQ